MPQKGRAAAPRKRRAAKPRTTLGSVVFKARRDLGLTQAELAEHAGVAVTTISIVENDHGRPHLATLRLLADSLDLPLEELIELSGHLDGHR